MKNLGDNVKASPLPKAKIVPTLSRRGGAHGGEGWVVEYIPKDEKAGPPRPGGQLVYAPPPRPADGPGGPPAPRCPRGDYKKFKIVLFYLFSLGFSEIVKSKLFHGYGGTSASSLAIGDIVNLTRFWYNTVFFFRRIYCGLEANIILLGLSIIALLILKKTRILEVFLIGFLAVSSLPFLSCDAIIKSRVIYNIPIGLYTAYSFTWLIRQKIKI